jgi:hypothetical protein
MKITTIKHLTFHRNGSGAGEPFYSAILTTNEDKGLHFFVSFACANSDPKFASEESFRVVCIEKPASNWRGDNFCLAFNQYFRDNTYIANPNSTLYDWTVNNTGRLNMDKAFYSLTNKPAHFS